jgi:hypothetical protein
MWQMKQKLHTLRLQLKQRFGGARNNVAARPAFQKSSGN